MEALQLGARATCHTRAISRTKLPQTTLLAKAMSSRRLAPSTMTIWSGAGLPPAVFGCVVRAKEGAPHADIDASRVGPGRAGASAVVADEPLVGAPRPKSTARLSDRVDDHGLACERIEDGHEGGLPT